MPILHEYLENSDAGESSLSSNQHPLLCLLSQHSQNMEFIPRATISERIEKNKIRWRGTFVSHGEISYLPKFWEWYTWIQKLIHKKNLRDLAVAVNSTAKDYHRPNSSCRALPKDFQRKDEFFTSPNPLLNQTSENRDMIDAFDEIDDINSSKDLPCKIP
ncbi:hypothetical protein Adt_45031 [Abeliophyllum distichum]|uniref:Uncharacterized protein n=1 Tax=Abeliophyllum distichum TaxID=126358 RepID=A0ABD1PCJ6_9LAMI